MSLFSGRNQDPVNKRENASAEADSQPPQDSHSNASTASSERQPSGPSGGPTKRGAKLRSKGETVAAIGSTIVFSGELTGDEDLEILGKVKGRIELPSHQLTVGEGGSVTAEIEAKSVLVIGEICGNVTATERVEVQANGIVQGDIRAPRLLILEGAEVNGSIEMTRADGPTRAKAPAPGPSLGAATVVAPPTA